MNACYVPGTALAILHLIISSHPHSSSDWWEEWYRLQMGSLWAQKVKQGPQGHKREWQAGPEPGAGCLRVAVFAMLSVTQAGLWVTCIAQNLRFPFKSSSVQKCCSSFVNIFEGVVDKGKWFFKETEQ